MKKKIFLVALVLILTSVTALAVWQWDNIVAVVDGIRYDDEQIAQKAATSVQKVDQYFEDNQLNKVTPMTPEQEEALQNGEITSEDAVRIMTGQLTLEEAKEANIIEEKHSSTDGAHDKESVDTDNRSDSLSGSDEDNRKSESDSSVGTDNAYNFSKPEKEAEAKGKQPEPVANPDEKQTEPDIKQDVDSAESNKSTKEKESSPGSGDADKAESVTPSGESDLDSMISAKVAELYVIKSNFYAEFNSKYNAVRSAFLARPASEITKANRAATVRSYMSEGLAMERECDAQVEAVLSELSGLLRSAGRDQSLVDSIRSAYNSEKSALKSRLVNKYF